MRFLKKEDKATSNFFCKLLGRVVQVAHVIYVAQEVQVVQMIYIVWSDWLR